MGIENEPGGLNPENDSSFDKESLENEKFADPVIWKEYFAQPPERDTVDPEHTLSKEDLIEVINRSFEERGVDQHALGSLDVSEYPELIDEGIQGLCEKINAQNFVRTYASCEGHPLDVDLSREIPSDQVGRVGNNLLYIEPNLSLLLDRRDERTGEFVKSILKARKELVSEYPGLTISIDKENIDDRVGQLSFNVSLEVPAKWIEEQGKRTTEELNVLIQGKKRELGIIEPPEKDLFSKQGDFENAVQEWQEQHGEKYRKWENDYYFGLYWKEYGEYFDSPEARQAIRSFFNSVDVATESSVQE